MNLKKIHTPLDKETILHLKAGEHVLFSGDVYTLRDAAHKRLVELYNRHHLVGGKEGEKILDISGQIVYYTGLTPLLSNGCPGSAGPTTSIRMDKYTPQLLDAGMAAMIGKGPRGLDVTRSIRDHQSVYFVTVGGAGAFFAQKIKKAEIVAFEDLGCEAVFRLSVEDFPLWVGVDSRGKTMWDTI
ncbi:fumarate hydratase C-terminal domain-containing protein [bacterium]|nr:fumarate hydratase C-terminal domain-containing protein [bacterium]MBU1753370.1 fumarate hydratase C-terminal domain-containing protein [bacterium]